MVNLTSFLMIYTFIILSLIIKELEANEISTLKILWCILQAVLRTTCLIELTYDAIEYTSDWTRFEHTMI